MCGRFDRHSSSARIIHEFNVDRVFTVIEPRYNIAPSQDIVVVRRDGTNVMIACRWGYIPAWAKEEKIGYSMINARAETIETKPAFSKAFSNQRCLIVADGFYEWKKYEGRKVPFYIRMRSKKPFGFAGLFNVWSSPRGEGICTSTLITTQANELLMPIHDRMPVIIPPQSYDVWLDPDFRDAKSLKDLLLPYPSDLMEIFQVSPSVNSPSYDSEEAINPWRPDR